MMQPLSGAFDDISTETAPDHVSGDGVPPF